MVQAQRQRLLNAEKDIQWKINNIKYYYHRCKPLNLHFEALFKAANGEMDISEYNYFTNPFGNAVANRPELQSYPAKMRNVPIIPDIFNKLVGEMRDRPLVKQVTVTNGDMINKKRFEEVQFLKQNLEQIYINELESLGLETGRDAKPVEPLNKIMKEFSDNWSDSRIITGQKILNYISDNIDLPEQFIEGFKYWVITGCVYSIKDVVGDDVVYEIVNPQNVGFIKDENVKFIEDAEAACVVRRFTRASFIDRYSEMITKEPDYHDILDYLESQNRGGADRTFIVDEPAMMYERSTEFMSYTRDGNFTWLGDTVEVAYINWTSEELIKVVAITNDTGEVETKEMPDDYVVSEEFGETLVEEYWRTVKWEGYAVNGEKFYFGIRPIPIQRNLLDRKSKCKNLINGRMKVLGHRKQLSIIELLLPFQHLYNVIHYKLMNIIAKAKEKMLVMPVGLFPKVNGWDMYTSMFHMDATGILWVDESNPQAQIALNSIKAVDMSLGAMMSETINLLNTIKAQAESLVGMSPQRKGQVGNRDGASTTQIAQAQSFQISEDLFAEYEKFQERELNGLLDISKHAFINGKKASYINSEGRLEVLALQEGLGDYAEAEVGVRVKSSSLEKKRMEKMEAMAETLASQKGSPSMLAAILHTDTMNELVNKLQAIEDMERQYAAQQEQLQRDHEEKLAEKIDARERDKMTLEYYKVDTAANTAKEVKLIDSDTKMMGLDLDKNGVADSIQIANQALQRDKQFFDQSVQQEKAIREGVDMQHKQKVDNKKLEIETKKLDLAKEKLATEKYKVDKQFAIAKENKP